MAQLTGTHDISTLLAARFQSVAEFGMDSIIPILNADLAAHNQIVAEMVSEFCDMTTDRQRIYGSAIEGEMQETDEYGKPRTQRDLPGDTVGFPLKLFQIGVGWTRKWMQTHTPADLAEKVILVEKAHLHRIRVEVKKAIFNNTNYTYRDHLVDNVDLAIKRLVNADGAKIPPGPNGEAFDGATHQHYFAEATLTNDNVLACIDNLVEHGHGGLVKMCINRGNETAVRALADFKAYTDPRLIYRVTDTPGQTLDITRLDNRAIGLLGAAEVWVKPWVPLNYAFYYDAAGAKPLAFRQRATESLQGLRIAAELEDHPLIAQYMEAEFGIGVWVRTAGVCHYFNGDAWVNPTNTN